MFRHVFCRIKARRGFPKLAWKIVDGTSSQKSCGTRLVNAISCLSFLAWTQNCISCIQERTTDKRKFGAKSATHYKGIG